MQGKKGEMEKFRRPTSGAIRKNGELSPSDLECIDRYLVVPHLTRAWCAVFKGPDYIATDKDRVRASQWFNRARVQQRYQQIKYSEKHYQVALRRQVGEEARALAMSRINRVASWDSEGLRLTPSDQLADADAASIQSIKVSKRTRMKGEEVIEETDVSLKLADKNAALANLAKFEGMNREQQPAGIRFAVQVVNQYQPPNGKP